MKIFRRYAITFLIGFLLVGLVLWVRNIFAQTELSNIFLTLTDAFFISGVLLTGAGAIVFTSNHGAFDMLAYGMTSFIDLFREKEKRKYESFYDYKVSKGDKKTSFGFLLISGVFFLAVSMIMLALYHKYI